MACLTGRTRFRTQRRLFKEPLLVLQVEYVGWNSGGKDVMSWRDATVSDLGHFHSHFSPKK